MIDWSSAERVAEYFWSMISIVAWAIARAKIAMISRVVCAKARTSLE